VTLRPEAAPACAAASPVGAAAFASCSGGTTAPSAGPAVVAAPSSIQREMSTTPQMATAMPRSVDARRAAPMRSRAKTAVHSGSVLETGATAFTRPARNAW